MLRVDNGGPWGSCNDLPPQLALWFIGLGVRMHWNPPRQPQQNGVIERTHGVALCWGEPKQCRSVREFQTRIDHEDSVQREMYRAINGRSRMAAYPELRHSDRTYTLAWEQRHWDWNRVLEHLSEYVVARRVDCSGKIGHYGGQLYVGHMHKGTLVYVQFDPDRVEWVINASDGRHLRSLPAKLKPRAVRTLSIRPRRPR
jgi:hypothetical protein